jgi:hypothetical protein
MSHEPGSFLKTSCNAPRVIVGSRSQAKRRWLNRLLVAGIAIVILAADVLPASAQFVNFYRRGFYPYGLNAWALGGYGYSSPYYGYNRGYYGRRSGYGGMAGTALSANEMGMSRVIAASGYANLQNSQATQNVLQARSTDFNNRVTWTSDYYQMRQAHRTNDASRTRLSTEDAAKIAHAAAPRVPESSQFDPATGNVSWPVILQDARYIETRDELENHYRSQVAGAKPDAESYLAFNKSCETLLGELKANMRDYSANDYQQARHFVEGLRAAGRQATAK